MDGSEWRECLPTNLNPWSSWLIQNSNFKIPNMARRTSRSKASRSWHLKRLYNHFNKKWFSSRLPSNTLVEFGSTPKANGITWYIPLPAMRAAIILPPILKRTGWNLVAMALLHEMVHLDVMRRFSTQHNHGGKFKEGMRALAAAGAFDRYW